MNLSLLFPFGYLIILSLFDIATYNKDKGYIPSFLTSGYIVMSLVIMGESGIYGGVIGFSVAYLLADLELFGGWADFKALIGTSIILNDIFLILIYTLVITILSILYKSYAIKKDPTRKYIPFLPVMFLSYVFILVGIFF